MFRWGRGRSLLVGRIGVVGWRGVFCDYEFWARGVGGADYDFDVRG